MSVETTPQNCDPDIEEVLRYRSIWLTTPGKALTRQKAFEAFFGRLMQLEAFGKMQLFWKNLADSRSHPDTPRSVVSITILKKDSAQQQKRISRKRRKERPTTGRERRAERRVKRNA